MCVHACIVSTSPVVCWVLCCSAPPPSPFAFWPPSPAGPSPSLPAHWNIGPAAAPTRTNTHTHTPHMIEDIAWNTFSLLQTLMIVCVTLTFTLTLNTNFMLNFNGFFCEDQFFIQHWKVSPVSLFTCTHITIHLPKKTVWKQHPLSLQISSKNKVEGRWEIWTELL